MKKEDTPKILALIPARLGSSRFPGKPLAQILGKPMIGHVYDSVKRTPELMLTAVATCDREIANYVESIGGTAVMTRDDHERASDRCAEALPKVEAELGTKFDIVVMVQGDEPMTKPEMVSEALQPMLENSGVLVVNLLGPIISEFELLDKNCIKVVCDLYNNALYFSRQAIHPWSTPQRRNIGKQVCIIPFQRDFLLEYSRLEPTPLEIIESIDMLRVLEHGGNVRMVPTIYDTHAVDTKEDLQRVEVLMSTVN